MCWYTFNAGVVKLSADKFSMLRLSRAHFTVLLFVSNNKYDGQQAAARCYALENI